MKTYITILIVSLYLLLCSCGGASINSKNAINYSLTVVCTDKISSNENKQYPKEIISLIKPINLATDGKFLMPNPILVIRLLADKQPYQEDLLLLKGNETNFKSHQNRVETYFIKGKGKEVNKQLMVDNVASFNESNALHLYLSNLGKKEKVFYFSKKPKADSINNEKLFNDIDTLKRAISDYLVDSPGHEICVIYNTPEIIRVDTVNSPPPHDTNAKTTKMAEPIATVKKKYNEKINAKHTESIIGDLQYRYATYHGEKKNGLPCGGGTMTFLEDHAISKHDSRIAKKGDKIIGYWVNGEISNGKWIGSDGKPLQKIFIGTTGDCK